jgi:hypothetical protein
MCKGTKMDSCRDKWKQNPFCVALFYVISFGQAYGQFTSVINVPPNTPPHAVPADTQVNVYAGGAFGGRFNEALEGSEVNFLGGGSGLVFRARSGSTVNVVDGLIGFGFQAQGEVRVSGGTIDYGFNAQPGSNVSISGGYFAERIRIDAGSNVAFRGGDFRIDGLAIAGLEQPGAMVPLSLPPASLLTGVFADGTPFAFSSLDGDVLADGAVTLESVMLPAAPPGVITASIDGVPRGVRNGQTLIVDQGARVGNNFNVAAGGVLEVRTGGTVLNELEAVDATVRVVGGTIGDRLDLFAGSALEIHSGQVNSSANVFNHSSMDIRGGRISSVRAHSGGILRLHGGETGLLTASLGGQVHVRGGAAIFDVEPGSAVRFFGADFRIDGVSVDLSNPPPGGIVVDIPLNSNLSGVLASGEPFVVRHKTHQALPDGVITLSVEPPPPIAKPVVVTSQDGPIRGVRQGQHVTVDSALGLPQLSSAFYADVVRIVPGGSVGAGFKAIGTPIVLDGGSIGASFELFEDATLTIHSGMAAGNSNAYTGSRVEMTGGSLGPNLRIWEGASGHFSGGSIGGMSVSGDVVITGGVLGAGFNVNDGGRIDLFGGQLPEDTSTTPDFDAFSGSEVHLYGTEFFLSGQPISGLTYGVPKTITQRRQQLSGTLLDGSTIVLGLHSENEGGGCCVNYDYFDANALLTVTLLMPGDFDRDGTVDAADYVVWRRIDGTQAGYDAWRTNFRRTAGSGNATAAVSFEAAVPEPVSWLLAVLMTWFVGGRFRSAVR